MSAPLSGLTVVFDLDGTLVDTAPDLIGALNAVLSARGLPRLPLEAARHLVGRGARALIQRGFEEAGEPLAPAETDGLVALFLDHYRAHIADESAVFDGLAGALDQLEAQGCRLAVCTNKPTEFAELLLTRLGLRDRFAAVVGYDLAPAPKPDARHLLETVRRAGGDPDRVVMVGDSLADVSAARGAGAPVVVVSFGYTETPAAELGGDRLIDRYADLPGAVAELT